MPLDELYPPYQYGWGWLVLALGLLALIVLAAWAVIFFTRPRRIPEETKAERPKLTGDVISQLRMEYSQSLRKVMADHDARRIDGREANRRMSALVRRFVNEYSGLEAPVLALDDLRGLGVHPALLDALQRHYYPSIFRRDHVVDPRAGAVAAQKVIDLWH